MQEESGFSLLFSDGTFYYKFTPHFYAHNILSSMQKKAKRPPCAPLQYVRNT